MAPLAVVDGDSPEDPRFAGWSRLVPRFSWHNRQLLSELPQDRAGAIAKALAQASADAQMVLGAHSDPHRDVVLEPEAWRNQRGLDDRSREFRRLGPAASLARPFEPATLRTAAATALVDYIMAFINAEEARGADVLLPPYHLAGGLGTASRDGELRLAETAVALIRRRGLHERGHATKPLLVGIAIEAHHIDSPAGAGDLARAYSGLGADGFWVHVAHLSEDAPEARISACAMFLFALQDLSGKRVFAVDAKNLIWPLLAGGLSGACIGIGERESWAGLESVSTERRKLKPTVVHQTLLRNFAAAGANARKAFSSYPCDCGVHEPGAVPSKQPDIRRHALRVRLGMELAVTGAEPAGTIEAWLQAAGWAAGELGLDQPRVEAYRAVLAAATDWRSALGL